MLTNDQGDETECTLNKSMGDSKLGKLLTEGRAAIQRDPQRAGEMG